MRRGARVVPLLGAATLFLSPLAPIQAQPKGAAKGLSKEQRERAKKLFDDAEAYYNIGEYDKALSGYREAYLLSKEPALLFNMGQCYRLLGKREEAIKVYRSFIKEAPDSPLRPNVEEIILSLQAELQKGQDPGPQPPQSQALSPAEPGGPPPGGPAPAEPVAGRPLRRFALPGALGVAGLAFGAGALSLRNKVEQSGEIDRATQRRGLAISIASDLSLLSAGVTLFLALRPKKEAAASLASTAEGALSRTTPGGAP
jgi:tetratricopeptide (TPR) repeat protein